MRCEMRDENVEKTYLCPCCPILPRVFWGLVPACMGLMDGWGGRDVRAGVQQGQARVEDDEEDGAARTKTGRTGGTAGVDEQRRARS